MRPIKPESKIVYIGVEDKTLDLFESQYPVPNGVTYNSYLIDDEKIAVMDTADARVSDAWLANLEEALAGRTPDYLVVQHMEPDHSASIRRVMERYPAMQIVASQKAFPMMQQFFGESYEDRRVVVKEGDTLALGAHTLTFAMAAMVHWPEVMVSYESNEKVLFSADAFGTFGPFEKSEDWVTEARRYYINIVGKYGAPVQALLKKAAALEIETVCPLHGPVLTEDLGTVVSLYDTWSSYRPETKGVLVACASIHGNTKRAAEELAEMLKAKGETVVFFDLTRGDVAAATAEAFRFDRMVLCCSTYDTGIFTAGEHFLAHLKAKTYQNRTVGLMENGSWAPMSGKHMKAAFAEMKNITVVEPMVTLKGAANEAARAQMAALCDALTAESL
ncbi:MAG: FprA family A-type flavoprotein [Clostridia bacterium]|nr:FprA family A-type flavoprotein [Clostridia bacterium]